MWRAKLGSYGHFFCRLPAPNKLYPAGRIFLISYWIGRAGGYLFDLAALVTGRQFPIRSIRIKKFCTGTQIAADKLHETGFSPRYSLEQGLERMIAADFQPNSQPRSRYPLPVILYPPSVWRGLSAFFVAGGFG